jgi:hypothetical protein
MWKKVVSLFLIICLLATLVGCGGNPVVPPTDEEEGTAGVFESDSSGNLQYYDPLINKEVKISIIDNNSKEPVPGIQIFIFNNGEKIWVYSNDPSGKYFPSFYCEEITKLKQEKSLTLIITLAVIACIGPMVVAIIMQISENAQFFPDEKGYDKIVKTGKLEDILSAMETNNWKLMQIGPEVLTKLGMESEPYHQYAELFSGNDAEKWKEELLDQGLSEHDTYQYGYYQINNNFAEHYVDIVGGDSLANWVDHQNDMTIVYLMDLEEENENHPPVISDLSADPPSVNINQTTTITCFASDPDGDPLTYHWTKNVGSFEGSTSGSFVTWRAPFTTDIYTVVSCEVSDGEGGEDSESINIVVTESEEPSGIYALRDIGPAGGYIFYDKGSYSNGWRYLEAAPASTEWTHKEWGGWGTLIGGTETGIGIGQSNTTKIVTWLNSHSETGKAAQLCDALVYGGYSDWFLPSLDELNLMYENLIIFGVGGFPASGDYWSSSEHLTYFSFIQRFSSYDTSSMQLAAKKTDTNRVRAVRAF